MKTLRQIYESFLFAAKALKSNVFARYYRIGGWDFWQYLDATYAGPNFFRSNF